MTQPARTASVGQSTQIAMNNTITLKKRCALTAAALTIACTGFASAATFLFVPFEFQDATLPGDLPNDPALSPIEVSLSVEESAGMLFFVILNSSDQLDGNIDGTKPVVTSIFIEDPNDILAACRT